MLFKLFFFFLQFTPISRLFFHVFVPFKFINRGVFFKYFFLFVISDRFAPFFPGLAVGVSDLGPKWVRLLQMGQIRTVFFFKIRCTECQIPKMKYDLKILVFIYFYYFFANLTHFRLKSDTHFHQLSPSLGQNVVNLAQFVANQSRDSSSWRHKSISLERGKPGNVDHFLYLLHNKQFTKQCY